MRVGVVGVGRIGAFHAATLALLPQVEQVVVADAVPTAAHDLAEHHGYHAATDLEDLLGRVDAVVITTSTASHAETLRAVVTKGLPAFCEKPVAVALAETVDLLRFVEERDAVVQVGFQRRFDTGYRRAKESVDSGDLGFVHTVRATTHDQSPPPAAYLPTSGGLFRDCSIHDFDVLRFVTGREVRSVCALGANKGEDYFTDAGDVDTCAAVLRFDDDTLGTVSATRYNGGGHDVRLEVMGSEGTIGVGYDDSLALRSAEPGASYPSGPQKWSYMERFEVAYEAELTAFTEVATGSRPSPCTVADALAAFRVAEACELSRAEGRLVELTEIPGG